MNSRVLGFNGVRLDPVSDMAHLGNGQRAYTPVLMRFNCPDSWSPFGPGGMDRYAYCAGDPVNRTDPSGHFSLGQWIGMGAGLLAGIALSVVTEGAAMPAVLSLMAMVAGNAAIGAGAELVTETVDGQRIHWGQVGIAAGLSAAVTLAGYGLGMASKLKGTRQRPFGGLMMARGDHPFSPNNERYFMGISGDMAAFAYGEMLEGRAVLSVYGHNIALANGRAGFLLFSPIDTNSLHNQLMRFVLGYPRYPVIRLDFCNSAEMARELSSILPGRIVGGFNGFPRLGFNPEASAVISEAPRIFNHTEGALRHKWLQARAHFLQSLPSDYRFNMDIDDQQGTYFLWYRNGLFTGRADITGVRTSGKLEE